MCQKLFHGLEFLAPNKYEIDLSNEVLNFDFGQRATKILKVNQGPPLKKSIKRYATLEYLTNEQEAQSTQ